MRNVPIGEILRQSGYISEEQLQTALQYQKENRDKRIGEVVVELGFVTEEQKLDALAKRLAMPLIDINNTEFEIDAVGKIPKQMALENNIIAFSMNEHSLKVILSDPLNLYGIEEVSQTVGMQLDIYLARKDLIENAIHYYYAEVDARKATETANRVVQDGDDLQDLVLDDSEDDAPIIQLVMSLIVRGYNAGASDIHIEPFEEKTIVRMRVDGTIIPYVTLQSSIHQSVVARIKIMSNLDIAEKRVPQDGHYRTRINGENVNIRISVVPTVFGEKVVLRILATKGAVDHANHFGMNQAHFDLFSRMMTSPNGIVYITGPTGSGKSTTLYMALEQLAKKNVNISTIEDPVEKNISNINQMQVNNPAGVTFDVGLRALLRQDPDIIMVGETRDAETATISVRAAITGHLVFSTLHTNDAVSSIVRLKDMGIEPYLIASSVVGLVAQRLVKKVCPHCAVTRETTPEERRYLGESILSVKEAEGCPSCNNTGYFGRTAIHEIALVDAGLRQMIAADASLDQMTAYCVAEQGMKTLRDGCLDLLRAGVTTMEEFIKIAYHSL